MAEIHLRPYEPPDEPCVYALWRATLSAAWPLSPERLHRVIGGTGAYVPGDHWVAASDHELIGFAATQSRSVIGEAAPRGEIMLVMVDPGRQRCGIGRRLLDQALAQLKQKGVREAQLGGGGLSYFWPGVPSEPPGAWAFFEACGWQRRESSYDLVCDLPEYRTPSGLRERVSRQGIVISSPEPKEIPALLEYEKQHFPQWLPGFEQPAATGEYGDLLVARDPEGAIVGSVQVLSPQSRWQAGGFVWEQLLGKDTGGIGSLGVMPAMEGRGIGLALAARATELLQARGLKTSYVGWTWLVDWYGRLGYRVWQEYRMCWKKLEESSG